MACSPILQMRRMLHARSSRGVSLAYFGVLIPGFGMWVAYGVASANLAVIVPNAVALAMHVATAMLTFTLRADGGMRESRAPSSQPRRES